MREKSVLIRALGGSKILGSSVLSEDQLREVIQRGLPYGAVESFLARFNLALKDLARIGRISPRTMARRRKARRLEREESDRLYRMARILVRAEEVFGDRNKASRWLRRSHPLLNGQKPLEMLDTDIGSRQVDTLLGRIEHGVYS
jgi:putative toxin-antitoxin system antitoxin component (TIGR02293 family)